MSKKLIMAALVAAGGGGAYFAATDPSLIAGLLEAVPISGKTATELDSAPSGEVDWEVEYVDGSGAKMQPGNSSAGWLNKIGLGNVGQGSSLSLPKAPFAASRSAPQRQRSQNESLSKPRAG